MRTLQDHHGFGVWVRSLWAGHRAGMSEAAQAVDAVVAELIIVEIRRRYGEDDLYEVRMDSAFQIGRIEGFATVAMLIVDRHGDRGLARRIAGLIQREGKDPARYGLGFLFE